MNLGGLPTVVIALGLTDWVGLCRLIRGEVIKLRDQDFVVAARAMGLGGRRIMTRHILPNTFHIVLITFSLSSVGYVQAETVLAFLGLGITTKPSWGKMIDDSRLELLQGVWWQFDGGDGGDFGFVVGAECAGRCAAGCAGSEVAGSQIMAKPLLELRNLSIAFDTEGGQIRPVQDVSLSIFPGQTLAVVGESGCGKSVTALSILRLIPSPPGRVLGGQVLFEGRDLLALSEKEMRGVRGKDIAMIFQEPMTSLNPVFTVGEQIVEAVQLHQKVGTKEAYKIAEEAMHDVGIADPGKRIHEYPHRLSGGMRQRVMIAMALSCRPKLLIADEPTTALDVTIQAQILELLRRLQEERGMAVMLITHDLGVVAENADAVAVMYASKVVEYAADHRSVRFAEASVHGRVVPRDAEAGACGREACRRFPGRCRTRGDFHRDANSIRDVPRMNGDVLCAESEPSLREVAPGIGHRAITSRISPLNRSLRRHRTWFGRTRRRGHDAHFCKSRI